MLIKMPFIKLYYAFMYEFSGFVRVLVRPYSEWDLFHYFYEIQYFFSLAQFFKSEKISSFFLEETYFSLHKYGKIDFA